jgi:hypothetical protein
VAVKSNRVLPHEGHDIYSVFVVRTRPACSIPNAADTIWEEVISPAFLSHIPSPEPSIIWGPMSEDALI